MGLMDGMGGCALFRAYPFRPFRPWGMKSLCFIHENL